MALPNTAPANMGSAFGMSLEEFQQFAQVHDGFWELDEGTPVKMQSPSIRHQWISAQVTTVFTQYLSGHKCAGLADMDVWVGRFPPSDTAHKAAASVRRPDFLVYCSRNQEYRDMILHPQLVVEIWSPTNSLKERSKKMEEYFRIGVQEFWQIDQEAQNFTLFSFENRDLRFLSGGTFHEPLESEYFPGLKVDLSEYYTRFADTAAIEQ